MLSFNLLGPGNLLGQTSAVVSVNDSTVSWTEADLCAFTALMCSACSWSDSLHF